jgi:tRNA-splicing ligase RtcB (3'-phosphate/5'-hydroxy nucleic acid ligase)
LVDHGLNGHRVVRDRGLGNALALTSSPLGAGRNFSRSAVRKQLTASDLRDAMVGIE